MEEESSSKRDILEFLSEHTAPLLGTLRVYVQRLGLATGEEGTRSQLSNSSRRQILPC